MHHSIKFALRRGQGLPIVNPRSEPTPKKTDWDFVTAAYESEAEECASCQYLEGGECLLGTGGYTCAWMCPALDRIKEEQAA